jgi:hypothetical protein
MAMEFTHPELDQEVRTISGYYVPREEHVMPCDGRQVLYIVGDACIDASCCGTASWSYIQVPGYLFQKQIRGGGEQPVVSEIEMITDKAVRQKITESLQKTYPGARVEIW